MLKIERTNKRWIFFTVFILLAILVGVKAWQLNHGIKKLSEVTTNKKITKNSPKLVSVESDILFAGNSFWGRYTNDTAKKSADPAKFPFERLKEFDREKYDAWITGLECPTTAKGAKMTSAEMEATLTFNCDPSYLGEFAKWFTAVTLANNHTDNMGADGFLETKQALDSHKIQYFGHYDPEAIDELCKVVVIPARANYSDNSQKKVKLPITMCGYHGVFKIPSQASIAEIAKYAEYTPVISMPHAGAEYKPSPDEIKTSMYHNMIDAGADMVIGDHPHWIQNTESYKGRLIAYSMGNFMFDQQFNDEVTRSASIEVSLKIDSNKLPEVTRWLDLAETCLADNKECLGQAKKLGLAKYTTNYSYGFVPVSNKGYQTHPAPELREAIEKRLNWNSTMSLLEKQ